MRFKRLHPAAQLPKRQNTGDAGYDLHALRDTSIEHLSIIETGVAVAIPEGYVGIIKDRSGMAAKIGAHTLAGVIDSGYRGDIKVVMTSPVDLVVRAGDRIAQMVVVPCLMEASEWVEDLDATDRGDKGFGSSGQ